MQLDAATLTNEEKLQRLQIVVDAWKHGVDVQMHFNEIEMTVRNLYFTILAASLALVGVIYETEFELSPGTKVSLPMVVILGIIPISMLFYFIDRHWYHRLLMGAVNHCAKIEETYGVELPEIQLGLEISKASPVRFKRRRWRFLFFFVHDQRFRDNLELHSDQKIEVLYKSVIWGVLAIVVIYGVLGGVHIRQCSVIPWVLGWPCGTVVAEQQAGAGTSIAEPASTATANNADTATKPSPPQTDGSGDTATTAPTGTANNPDTATTTAPAQTDGSGDPNATAPTADESSSPTN